MSIITLTTDFGTSSPYVAQMKAAILGIAPDATLVDITHAIRPQDVRQGAIVLAATAPHFPLGSIHLAVVDPGVGTSRPLVAARIDSRLYVAPDNGLLSRLTASVPAEQIVELAERRYWRAAVSRTFHGRDIMAPVAAHLAGGVELAALGPPRDRLVSLDWPLPEVAPGRISGRVESIDSFGNLVTNISGELLDAASAGSVRIRCGDTRPIAGLSATYGQQPAGTLVALIGSGGLLEIASVNGSAANALGAGVDAPVEVTWR